MLSDTARRLRVQKIAEYALEYNFRFTAERRRTTTVHQARLLRQLDRAVNSWRESLYGTNVAEQQRKFLALRNAKWRYASSLP